jgi:hypothetical protein
MPRLIADISGTGSVADFNGREWVPPFDAICQWCHVSNKVHDLDSNFCFKCRQRIFVSTTEREARSDEAGGPRSEARRTTATDNHAGVAVEKTFTFVYWLIGIGVALGMLAYSWPILLAVAILLSPIFLFFYIRSRTAGRRPKSSPENRLSSTLFAEDYHPVPPPNTEPGWYDDPNTPNWLCFWNGRSWTNQEKPGPTQ